MGIRIRVELRRRDSRDAELLDQEPGELEVARAAGDVGREVVALGELDLGEVDEDKVPALGLRVGQVELVEDGGQAVELALHLGDGLGPEVVVVGLLEAHGAGFLEGRHGGEADAGVGCRDVLDEFWAADEPAWEGVSFFCVEIGGMWEKNIPTRQPVA